MSDESADRKQHSDSSALYRRGYLAYRDGDWAGAITALEAAEAESPGNAQTRHLLGLSLLEEATRRREACRWLNRALADSGREPHFIDNHLQCIRRCIALEEFDVALRLVRGFRRAGIAVSEPAPLIHACLAAGDHAAADALVNTLPAGHQRSYLNALSLHLQGHQQQARAGMRDALAQQSLIPGGGPDNGARVLLVYGTGLLDFRSRVGREMSFAIRGGHFNVHAFLPPATFKLDRLFVNTDLDQSNWARRLEQYQLVINCIADPETEAPALGWLQTVCRSTGVPVFNPPGEVLKSGRLDMHRRLGRIEGLFSPRTELLPAKRQPSLSYPLLWRPPGSSTGIGLARLESAGELDAHRQGQHGVCSEFLDFRSPDGLYRKYRVFVIGGEIFPEHCVAHTHWNVHSSSRLEHMRWDDTLQQAEKAFTENWRGSLTSSQQASLEALAAAVDLDYFGVDFSVLPDGDLIIFEANPMMRINDDYKHDFPYLAAATSRIKIACQARLKALMGSSTSR